MRFRLRIQAPAPLPAPVPDPDTILHSFPTTKKYVQNLAFLMSEAVLFPRKLASLLIFGFCTFMLDSYPTPIPEPESQCIPVPLMQKITVPAVPVPQHRLEEQDLIST